MWTFGQMDGRLERLIQQAVWGRLAQSNRERPPRPPESEASYEFARFTGISAWFWALGVAASAEIIPARWRTHK